MMSELIYGDTAMAFGCHDDSTTRHAVKTPRHRTRHYVTPSGVTTVRRNERQLQAHEDHEGHKEGLNQIGFLGFVICVVFVAGAAASWKPTS
jgi:hypothetical protein